MLGDLGAGRAPAQHLPPGLCAPGPIPADGRTKISPGRAAGGGAGGEPPATLTPPPSLPAWGCVPRRAVGLGMQPEPPRLPALSSGPKISPPGPTCVGGSCPSTAPAPPAPTPSLIFGGTRVVLGMLRGGAGTPLSSPVPCVPPVPKIPPGTSKHPGGWVFYVTNLQGLSLQGWWWPHQGAWSCSGVPPPHNIPADPGGVEVPSPLLWGRSPAAVAWLQGGFVRPAGIPALPAVP